MFCPKCGIATATGHRFCMQCGHEFSQSVSSGGAAVQTARPQPAPPKSNPTIGVMVVIGVTIAIWSIFALHPLAAVLTTLSLIVLSILFLMKSLSILTKAIALGIAVVLVAGVNGVEALQQHIADAKMAAARAEIQKHQAELQQREEAEFEAMSSSQHLEKAKTLLSGNPLPPLAAQGLRHLSAIPDDASESSQAKTVKQQYEAAKRVRDALAAKQQAAAEKKAQAEQASLNRVLRDAMAKTMENTMLDKGYNVDVKAIGKDHTVLHIKWILVSKVIAHQLSEKAELFDSMKKVGFKRLEITDGYDEDWYWTIN